MELPIIMESKTFTDVQSNTFPCCTGVGVPYHKGFCIIAGNICNNRPEVVKTGLEHDGFNQISIDKLPLTSKVNFEMRGLLKPIEIPEGNTICACGCGEDFTPINPQHEFKDKIHRKRGRAK